MTEYEHHPITPVNGMKNIKNSFDKDFYFCQSCFLQHFRISFYKSSNNLGIALKLYVYFPRIVEQNFINNILCIIYGKISVLYFFSQNTAQ